VRNRHKALSPFCRSGCVAACALAAPEVLHTNDDKWYNIARAVRRSRRLVRGTEKGNVLL